LGLLCVLSGSYSMILLRRKLGHLYAPEELSAIHRRNAIRIRSCAMELKGVLIKVGQIISTRRDLLPNEYINELGLLQDSVDPYDYEYVEKQIEESLGGHPDEIYDEFSREAVAAASLAQVHRARTKEGRDVAVKIQYPHIRYSLDIDFSVLRMVCKVLSCIKPGLDFRLLYDEISAAIRQEVDYEQEVRNLNEIRENLKDYPNVRIPEVLPELSRGRVITMEFLDGIRIGDVAAIDEMGYDKKVIVNLLGDCFGKQILEDGFFHSDPHPGNLFVLPGDEGQPVLGIVDFGQTKRLPPEIKVELKRTLMAWASKKPDLMVEAMLNLKMIKENQKEHALELVKDFIGNLKDFSPAKMATQDFSMMRMDMLDIVNEIPDLQLPQDLILYGRAASLLIGTGAALDPEVNPMTVLQPKLMKYLMSP